VSLVAAAVCPHPPLLVPQVGSGGSIVDEVRAAAIEAVRGLVAAGPQLVGVVGAGPQTSSFTPADSGSFRPFGVEMDVPLGPRACGGRASLPLSLTVGAWLLGQAGWQGERQAAAVSDAATAGEAAQVGVQVGRLAEQVAVLCMGDGSARRTEQAPGWLDERAAPFDGAVARALSTADTAALLELDIALARDLLVAGRAAWQALAGAAADADPAGGWRARISYDGAPFGVGYFVATWFLADGAMP
jgi:hypothetical protein